MWQSLFIDLWMCGSLREALAFTSCVYASCIHTYELRARVVCVENTRGFAAVVHLSGPCCMCTIAYTQSSLHSSSIVTFNFCTRRFVCAVLCGWPIRFVLNCEAFIEIIEQFDQNLCVSKTDDLYRS